MADTYTELTNAKFDAQKLASEQAARQGIMNLDIQGREIGPYYDALQHELERNYTNTVASTREGAARRTGTGTGSFIGPLIDLENKMGQQYNWQREQYGNERTRREQGLNEQRGYTLGVFAENDRSIANQRNLTNQLNAENAAKAASYGSGGGTGYSSGGIPKYSVFSEDLPANQGQGPVIKPQKNYKLPDYVNKMLPYYKG